MSESVLFILLLTWNESHLRSINRGISSKKYHVYSQNTTSALRLFQIHTQSHIQEEEEANLSCWSKSVDSELNRILCNKSSFTYNNGQQPKLHLQLARFQTKGITKKKLSFNFSKCDIYLYTYILYTIVIKTTKQK